ncbi:MAG: hypothetical protein JNL39_04310 [Opitutaceae bacterium]|nr:hypothetical protein [Opitutaceae bacterium]
MIRLLSAELFRYELRTRIPFRYGIATMIDVPQVVLRVACEIDGRPHAGLASDLLPPKWFTKDPARGLADEIEEMLRVLRQAVRLAEGVRAPTAFSFWRELYAAQMAWAGAEGLPPLLANFGTSFVERALIHAVCRARGLGLSAAFRCEALGCDFAALHPELAGVRPADVLPAAPPDFVLARHTVGLADPITAADLAPGERVDDGLPQTLDECIRRYGLRHFKLKIDGRAERDFERLARIAAVLQAECGADFAFSLDGNESFHDVTSFADYFRRLQAAPGLGGFWARLLYVEQPWHRGVALSPAIGELARAWPGRPPIIIDESDAEIGSLRTALDLGYAGTSHKNCKGVFKSVANAALLARRGGGVMSGEDLGNVGPIALTQDLAAQAALGIESVERNGHHYHTGLSLFPPALRDFALAAYPDLFVRDAAGGWPRLDLREGRLSVRTVNGAPFGMPGEPDFSELARVAL